MARIKIFGSPFYGISRMDDKRFSDCVFNDVIFIFLFTLFGVFYLNSCNESQK